MKKRILSALLAVCLLASLGTVGVFADEPETEPTANSVGTIKVGETTTSYDNTATFVEAINNAASGAVVTLLKDIEVDVDAPADTSAAIVIDVNMTFNGNGRTIKAKSTGTTDTGAHVLSVEGSVTAEISNLTIDGASVAHHGIHVFGGAKANLTNVTIGGHCAYGLVVNNGASVEADKLIVNAGAAGAWGSVNVDAKDTKATATLTGGSLASDLVLESKTGATNTVTLNNVKADIVKTNEKNNDGINSIDINGGNIDTVSLNGNGKDTVKIDDANVTTISSTVTNNEKPNITITGNSKIGTVPTDDSVDMVIGNDVTIGGKPAGNAEAEIKGQPYATLAEALADAKAGDVVKLLRDITVDLKDLNQDQGYFVINTSITLDGGNNTITATSTNTAEGKGQAHVIVVSNGNVTIQNLEIDGGNQVARYGIQAVGTTANVTLKNVEVNNCYAYGAFSNQGATVTANGLYTDDNGWGGVNVDTNGGNSKFVMNSGILADKYSIVIENSKSTNNTTSIDLNGGTYSPIQVKTDDTKLVINRGTYDGIEVVPTVNITNEITVNNGTFGESVKDYVNSKLIYEVRVGGEYTYYTNATDAIRAAGSVGDITYIGNDTYYTSNVTFVYDKNVKTTIEVVDNEVIYLPGGQYKGKTITGWTLGNVTYDVGDRYRVTSNATFYVVLKDGEFDITIDSKIDHGTITTNVNSADRGDVVRIYVDPDTGYVLDELKVYTGTNYRTSVKVTYVNDSTYRFTMPGDDVYITATFKANGMPFVDVHRTQWFYDSIYYVWSNDMMEGDSATTFNPDGTMTRAMFWAVLGRMDGQTITGTNWVEQARNWAMREGVSDGTNPNDYVTREQMVTMLWRYAGEKNGSANLNRYTDSGSVSGYAVEAMRWAIGNGVIQGVTSTTLAPKANATRAECATIFMRFDKM